MKKVISVFLAVLLLLSPISGINASAENSDGYFHEDEFNEALWNNYQFQSNGIVWEYLTEEEYCVTSGFAKKVAEDVWIDIFHGLSGTKYDEEQCLELLINYTTMLDLTPDEVVDKQAKFDRTMTLTEYGLDALEVGVDLISIHALGPEATSTMQTISTALELSASAADLTYDTIEKLEYADWSIRNYEKYSLFLNSIIKYSQKQELKTAASKLLLFSQKVLYSRLITASEVSGDVADFLGKDVFFDTVFLEGMLKDSATLSLTESDYQVASLFKTSYQTASAYLKAGFDLVALGSNVLGGLKDVCAQWLEVEVLDEIRKCLVLSAKELKGTIRSADDLELIQDFCSVLSSLACVHYRSIYCFTELYTANKAKLVGVIIRWTHSDRVAIAAEIMENYKEITLNCVSCISGIIPDINLYYRPPDNTGGGAAVV